MKRYYFFLIFFLLGLTACSNEHKSSSKEMITVQENIMQNVLYYSGIVQPLKTFVITSPADGTVIDMPFQYGEIVKSGQILFIISSSKFLSDYKSGLMTYVKAKNEYNNAQTQLNEANFLHSNKLISDDEYKMKKSNYYASRLALLQAKDTLENLLNQLDIKNINLYQLTIADIDKITNALQSSSDTLRILTPVAGMVLSPSKGEEENKKILKGDVVKQGDVLAIIGDMQGLTVRIKVNELTVNQLHMGQKVQVTGIAFPEDILEGEIKMIDHQGEVLGGGMPTFAVEVMVPKLTPQQQKTIHVGMSAKVEISIQEEPKLTVPITAIREKNGELFVEIFDEKNKQSKFVNVKTGKTGVDSVAILSGLRVGDKIVISH